MKNAAEIVIPSNPHYLSVVRAVTGQISSVAGMSGKEADKVKLAVDEACSNVIKHAYRGKTDRKIVVQFRIADDSFVVIIEDNGIKASPNKIKGRDFDDIRPGGLGIHLIERAFDTMSFDKRKKRGNRLRLMRRIRGR